MTKFEIVKELLGDNISELVAADLEESMKSIKNDMDNFGKGAPMFSYDETIEKEKLTELYNAFEKVLSYYKV